VEAEVKWSEDLSPESSESSFNYGDDDNEKSISKNELTVPFVIEWPEWPKFKRQKRLITEDDEEDKETSQDSTKRLESKIFDQGV